MNQAFVSAVVCAGVLFGSPAAAQGIVKLGYDYDELVKPSGSVTSLKSDLFGDSVSLYTGYTTFAITDVSIPGNNSLPVAVGRRFEVNDRNSRNYHGVFADWELDIPHLRGVFPAATGWQTSNTNPNQRCSVDRTNPISATPPVATGTRDGLFSSQEYWYGNTLYMPGSGDQKMVVAAPANPNLPADGKQYYWVTDQNWVLSCLPATANGVTGEAFLARGPDGTTYRFDWFVNRPFSYLQKARMPYSVPTPESFTELDRYEVMILPTRAEDRFGNWVSYAYDAANPKRLTAITSSDGRQVQLFYNASGHATSVVANGRTWSYRYRQDPSFPTLEGGLREVELPDLSRWNINFDGLVSAHISTGLQPSSCADPPYYHEGISTGTVTHPSGATGVFTVEVKRHGRSYVPLSCQQMVGGGAFPYEPRYTGAISITKKELSGPGVTSPMLWTYQYGPENASYSMECTSAPCPTTKQVTVTAPDGAWTRYTFSNRHNQGEGKVLLTELGDSTGVLRTQVDDYILDPVGQPFPGTIGSNPCHRCDNTGEVLNPLRSRTVSQSGASYTWTAGAFDAFARATRVTRASPWASRADITAYYDDRVKWVLGQTLSVTNENTGLVVSEARYDALARPDQIKSFGRVVQSLTYRADGTVASVLDGKNNTTVLNSWKRGVPQAVINADNTAVSAEVDDNGWILSSTDEKSSVTRYTYDDMGRIKVVDYPDNDSVNWTNSVSSFAPSSEAKYGLPVGHWRQTSCTGAACKVVYFDAMWRPVVQEEYDAGNAAGTLSQVVKRYDSNGRLAFESYPLRGVGLFTAEYSGTHTVYDTLGRVTDVSRDSELGRPLLTKTEYLPGNQTRVTDPRGNAVLSRYQVFDEPGYELPVWIQAADGSITEIARDLFGKPTSITRTGASQ